MSPAAPAVMRALSMSTMAGRCPDHLIQSARAVSEVRPRWRCCLTGLDQLRGCSTNRGNRHKPAKRFHWYAACLRSRATAAHMQWRLHLHGLPFWRRDRLSHPHDGMITLGTAKAALDHCSRCPITQPLTIPAGTSQFFHRRPGSGSSDGLRSALAITL